jgi:hypothetical protein
LLFNTPSMSRKRNQQSGTGCSMELAFIFRLSTSTATVVFNLSRNVFTRLHQLGWLLVTAEFFYSKVFPARRKKREGSGEGSGPGAHAQKGSEGLSSERFPEPEPV